MGLALFWAIVSFSLYHSVLDPDFVLSVMEIQALNEVFAGSHSEEAPLILGASKTVFGHTESSAGLLGIAKVLQQFRHGVVPGIALLDGTNISPKLDTSVVPLRISHEATILERKASIPLRALSL